jgi:hypothetical protein
MSIEHSQSSSYPCDGNRGSDRSPDLSTGCRSAPFRRKRINGMRELGQIGGSGIKETSDPLPRFFVAVVRRVAHDLEEFVVACRATDVFGRASSYGVDQEWRSQAWDCVFDALDFDGVLPPIAEVVEILQRLDAAIFQDIDEPGLLGVKRTFSEVGVRYTPPNASGSDLIEVAVGPPDRCLKHEMQAIKADGQRHDEPSHHCRLDAVESDFEDSNPGAHAASALRSWLQRNGSNSCSRDAG